MSGVIGYYVHHHGEGHRHRAVAIAGQSPEHFVLLGTGLAELAAGCRSLAIDDDRPYPHASSAPTEATDCLHYAPLDHEGIRRRVQKLLGWIAEHRPALMVVDVSVEIAMLARLASVPTVYMRLSGTRTDAGHLQAFRGARALMAPFHADLDDPSVPDWIRAKTRHIPGMTRAKKSACVVKNRILLVSGAGGGHMDGEAAAAAALATPEFQWRVIGPFIAPDAVPANLKFCGWIDNADQEIADADIVVGSAGDGVVNAVLASGRPFICLPQRRPYDEQLAKARSLRALGAAIVCERLPTPDEWPRVIARARKLDPADQARLHDDSGPRHAADFLMDIAGLVT